MTDRLLTRTSRDTPAACIACRRCRVASMRVALMRVVAAGRFRRRVHHDVRAGSASGGRPLLRSAATHSCDVRIVGFGVAADARDAIERARDCAAEKSARAGHTTERRGVDAPARSALALAAARRRAIRVDELSKSA